MRINSNERSEAIELIKHMDAVAKRNTWLIKAVGGESTINTGKQRMFPDVFVYGDEYRTQILQGWEVKMPDVPITDDAFIRDAQRKADTLRVNSCLIWNFSCAVLYVKDSTNQWTEKREWSLPHIRSRSDVIAYKADWAAKIEVILFELNSFFVNGEFHPSRIGDIIPDTIFTALITRNQQITSESLRSASVTNTVIQAYISQWWRSVREEYLFDEANMFSAYAKYVLLNWINKFTFAQMMKGNHNPAAQVELITESLKPNDALTVFDKITQQCDFYNIFSRLEFADILPDATWRDLTDYNAFLSSNGISSIQQEMLQSVLENSVNQFKRSIVGQFTTPPKLAAILAKAGIDDLTKPCIDPCCGTGTIVKEIISLKEQAMNIDSAFATTYAADKYSFPLQVSNISMTRANAINLPCFLFRSNAFELKTGNEIPITHPADGSLKTYRLPQWGSIVLNLPFVAFDQEGREETQHISATVARVFEETGINMSGRIDLYQAILLKLWETMADDASVAVITSNSWLGTNAGQDFFHALNRYYVVENIIASGNGKWFENADVITVMLFLHKKSSPQHKNENHIVNFGLIHKELKDLSNEDMQQVTDSIKLKRAIMPEILSYRSYSLKTIDHIVGMNIALNSLFYDVEWITEIQHVLCPVTEWFDVFRGMKTGQDEIYYLKDPSSVDTPYGGRIFKSAKSAERLIASPDTDAFVCKKTMEELRELGHTKTIQWIEKFEGHLNQSVPNKETFWMNLADGSFSGSEDVRLFTGMNPERRIFYGLLDKPAKINQRAIGFKPKEAAVDLPLCHALLNSALGIFYTEATGFPKGLGALDNRAENMKKISMLDPKRLSSSQRQNILDAFVPLLDRKILPTSDEFQQRDRIEFERTVLQCFGIGEYFERIRNAILGMQKVRLSVRQ